MQNKKRHLSSRKNTSKDIDITIFSEIISFVDFQPNIIFRKYKMFNIFIRFIECRLCHLIFKQLSISIAFFFHLQILNDFSLLRVLNRISSPKRQPNVSKKIYINAIKLYSFALRHKAFTSVLSTYNSTFSFFSSPALLKDCSDSTVARD